MKVCYSRSVFADGVKGRQDTHDLLAVGRKSALQRARGIRHPWYRCQALAMVAESETDPGTRNELLDESLAAAHEASEPNRVVTVATWPLKQLIHTNPAIAYDVVRRLLDTISQEPHGLRKLDGIAWVLRTVNCIPTLREHVLPPFLSAAAASAGWRTERIVAYTAVVLAESDLKTAVALLASRTPNRFSRNAGARLARIPECG
jgi:hypothetical protein